MRELIRERLSRRDLVKTKNGLEMLTRTIRGQIGEAASGETPSVLIDDLEVTWDELGQLLRSYAGFGLRLEIREAGEE
jgi:hypothetical protein